ncbi:MAG: stage II sporulation protein M, partial [Bacteroidetes bacterium]|nr:stage II sporulation protein M [Bacteroidota bacterium]
MPAAKMKENEFVRQNNQKWSELETSIETGERNPKKISRLFIQITDDLSYARTFYPNRSVREYLNGLSRYLNNDLAHKEKFSFSRVIDFFVTVLPAAMHASRKSMRLSFLVFAACMLLGMLTSLTDKDFAKEILGWSYVEVTEANIKKGKPMAIYESSTELKTFLPILFNNLRV